MLVTRVHNIYMAPYKYYVLLLVSKPDSYTVLLYAVSLVSFSLIYSPCCIHATFHIAILSVTFFPSVIKWCYTYPLFQNLLLCKVTMSVDWWQTISYYSIIVPLVSSCKGFDDCNLESWLVASGVEVLDSIWAMENKNWS